MLEYKIEEITGEEEVKNEVKNQIKYDKVISPSHYQTGLVETIVSIKNILGYEGFDSYCIGNIIKYISRYKTKNGIEDLEKAKTYLNFLIENQKNVL